MKTKIVLLSAVFFLLSHQTALSQKISKDFSLQNLLDDQTIWVNMEALKEFQKETSSTEPQKLTSNVESLLTTVNFDDVPFNGTAYVIAPNRYPGVSFYTPNTNSYTFTTGNFNVSPSFPNYLHVGAIHPYGYVIPLSPLAIDFSEEMRNVSFYVAFASPNCSFVSVDVYEYGQLRQTVPVSWGINDPIWKLVQLNSISERITHLRINAGCSVPSGLGTRIDDVTFQPNPSSGALGTLETVSTTGSIGAFGWSADPDAPTTSNQVECYVDTIDSNGYIGRVPANNPGSSPFPGNHRFAMPIPERYRDGNQHQMYCYGLDVIGNDPRTLLQGSPKPFKFNVPIGSLEGVDTDGYAHGWSQDLDLPAQSNVVHFYIDGVFAGEVTANMPRPDITPGNHGFRYYIPAQYRDNRQHTINAYGIDLTGDPPKILNGSPKTFTLGTAVASTTFEQLPESPLSENRNAGGGKRIFPDKRSPSDTTNRSLVKVKVRVSVPQANINVYFRPYDIDEPSTDALPIDVNGNNNGNDNRGIGNSSIYCSVNLNICPLSPNNAQYYATTDSNGEAVVYFSISNSSPGDNYAIAASTSETDISQTSVTGLNIQNYINGRIFQTGVDRTEMLTVWRKLHIEIDSMGEIRYNHATAQILEETEVGLLQVTLPVRNYLDPGRFENGTMIVNGEILYIDDNTQNTITVRSLFAPITVYPDINYTIYDDDDFNSDSWINGIDGDNGEDITTLDESFDLMQANDDTDCSDKVCNVFAAAYIEPDYTWVSYNTSDIQFVQNVAHDYDLTLEQVNRGRGSNSVEIDDFWVVYLQIAYQSGVDWDCEPNGKNCTAGSTPSLRANTRDIMRNYDQEMPIGGHGSLIFMESMRDFDENNPNSDQKFKIQTIPHEIGHQFGLKGDDRDPLALPVQGLMGYSGGFAFVDEHLNIFRWRRRSPGNPR